MVNGGIIFSTAWKKATGPSYKIFCIGKFLLGSSNGFISTRNAIIEKKR